MFTKEELRLLIQIVGNVEFQTSLNKLEKQVAPLLSIQKKLKEELENQNGKEKVDTEKSG